MKQTYTVIGIMSGSSMDGVDLAYCTFTKKENKWLFQINCAETVPYTEVWKARLLSLPQQSMEVYPKTHAFYGRYLGKLVNEFMAKHKVKPDLVASHGHTIFHDPNVGYTAQIGDGAAISAECSLPVVADFRTMDVALGGQGAPLVPIGDRILFSEYNACLNLGGISNLSFFTQNQSKAWDISVCNMVLNTVAEAMGFAYDDNGKIAAAGSVQTELLTALNALPFYTQEGAKSLGREWVNREFWPVVQGFQGIADQDLLATFVEHISFQIALALNQHLQGKEILVTGGGALNGYLMQKLQEKTHAKLLIPSIELVQYKEALIFALLGLLRICNEDNVLSSVTGSKQNHCGGALYGNFNTLI